MITEHLDLLGKRAADMVTGHQGIVTSISFDLSGQIRAAITSRMDKNGRIPAAYWSDVACMTIIDSTPVVKRSGFGDDLDGFNLVINKRNA